MEVKVTSKTVEGRTDGFTGRLRIQNSWGPKWGRGGFAHLSWAAFERQFMYGGFREGVFNGIDTLG